MRFISVLSLAFLLTYCGLKPVSLPNASEAEIILHTIASDKTEGRTPSSKGYKLAAKFLEKEMKNSGIEPYFNGSYRHNFKHEDEKMFNLVGVINAENSTDEYIMLSAHLDHVNEAAIDGDKIYNGANDNASGVVVVLEVAKRLAKQKGKINKNVLVTFFTAEEIGLIGSEELAKEMKSSNLKLSYMVNYEMVGVPLKNQPYKAYLTGYNESNMAEAFNKATNLEFLGFFDKASDYGLFTRSDNYPFYQQFKTPCQTICTFDFTNYDFYHHPKDEAQQLDYKHINEMIDLSYTGLFELLSKDVPIKLND